jgi:uncharacterized protein YjbI with pentapeptide repeats
VKGDPILPFPAISRDKAMTQETLSILTEAQNSAQPLRGLDLSGQTLAKVRLAGLVFDHCSFVGVTFSDSQLVGCVFLNCDLSKANFVGASFHQVRFETPLIKVDFTRASLTSCFWANGDFKEVIFNRASIFDCDFGQKPQFVKASLSSTVLANCRFGQTLFQGCALDLLVIRETVFSSLSLFNSMAIQIQACNLRLPGFSAQGSDLTLANFSSSDLTGANLTGARLEGAFFKEALLVGANLSGAKAAKAIFKGADLRKADLSKFVAPMADFSLANLTAANLTGVDLSGAKFHRAQGLDLTSVANAQGVSFTDEDLARAEDFRPSLVD